MDESVVPGGYIYIYIYRERERERERVRCDWCSTIYGNETCSLVCRIHADVLIWPRAKYDF
jgi:hypothetical protein